MLKLCYYPNTFTIEYNNNDNQTKLYFLQRDNLYLGITATINMNSNEKTQLQQRSIFKHIHTYNPNYNISNYFENSQNESNFLSKYFLLIFKDFYKKKSLQKTDFFKKFKLWRKFKYFGVCKCIFF